MPFLDDVEDMRAKTPAGRVPAPVLAGMAIVAVLVVLAAALGAASSARGGFVIERGDSSSPAASADSPGDEEGEGPDAFFVYVVGAVNHAGVYELPAGARVADAVEAAGGLADDADEAAVNLARPLVDGEQISIPAQGAQAAGSGEGAPSGDAAVPAAGSGTASGITADGKVNINLATAEELQSLSGIGEATAAKIIADREASGPFARKEDLKRVSGIGDKKYAAIADSITV